ncbi:hypothetical protein K4F52_002713 [Lecanicillium sp. MT-2017a]|nr:hypothetical protein K4F52_002713 [Lecanicillium sp. MT-2017a]
MGNAPSSEALPEQRRPQKLSKTRNTKLLSEDAVFDPYGSLAAPSAPNSLTPKTPQHGRMSRLGYSPAEQYARHSTQQNSTQQNTRSWPFVSSTYELEDGLQRRQVEELSSPQLSATPDPTSPGELSLSSSNNRVTPPHSHRYLLDPAKVYGTQVTNNSDSYFDEQDPNSQQQRYPHRRRSITQTPGVATRTHKPSSSVTSLRNATSMPFSMAQETPTAASQQSNTGLTPTSQSFPHPPQISTERSSTPCEAPYMQLGGITFGTLRITNGSPAPSLPEKTGETASKARPTKQLPSDTPTLSSDTQLHDVMPSPQPIRVVAPPQPQQPGKSFSARLRAPGYADNDFTPRESFEMENGKDETLQSGSLLHIRQSNSVSSQISRSDSGFGSSISEEGLGTRQPLSQSDSGYSSTFSLRSVKGTKTNQVNRDHWAVNQDGLSLDSTTSSDNLKHNFHSGNAPLKANQALSSHSRPNVLKSRRRASFQSRASDNHRRQSAGYFDPGTSTGAGGHLRSESDSAVWTRSVPSGDDLVSVPSVPCEVRQSLRSHIDWFQSTAKGPTKRTMQDRRKLQTIVSVDSLRSEQHGTKICQPLDSSGAPIPELSSELPDCYSSQTKALPSVPTRKESVKAVTRKPVNSTLPVSQCLEKGQKSHNTYSYHGTNKDNIEEFAATDNTRSSVSELPAFKNRNHTSGKIHSKPLIPSPAFLNHPPPDLYGHAKPACEVKSATSMPDIRHTRKLKVPPPISLRNRNAKQSEAVEATAAVKKVGSYDHIHDALCQSPTGEGTVTDGPPLVYRNGNRRGSEISLSEEGSPFRVLHSYYSPAYKNAPIWS